MRQQVCNQGVEVIQESILPGCRCHFLLAALVAVQSNNATIGRELGNREFIETLGINIGRRCWLAARQTRPLPIFVISCLEKRLLQICLVRLLTEHIQLTATVKFTELLSDGCKLGSRTL